MTNNPIPALPPDDAHDLDAVDDADAIIDDEDILDPDLDDNLINSAEADRRAAGGDYEP